MAFFDWLTGKGSWAAEGPADAGATETETVRKITRELDQLEPTRARYIAGFAYLLGRVAHADLEVSDEETREMEHIVVELGRVPEEQAIIVVQMAKTQNRLFGGTEDYLVSREFGKLATKEQKLALLECLYAVSASEGGISTVEDNEISKIAREVQLSREDLVQARSDWREHLNVLRDDDAAPLPDREGE